MTTLEKAARAMARGAFDDLPKTYDDWCDMGRPVNVDTQEHLLKLAKLALSSALLDPSDEVVEAALDVLAEWRIAPPRTAMRAALCAAGVKITGKD